jgi:hypothetical protein
MSYVVRHGRRIEVKTLDTGIAPKKKRRQFEAKWVKLPRHWITTLRQSKSASTYELAHTLLLEAYKHGYTAGVKIVLSEKTTHMPKTSRIRAAKELVELGVITFEQRGNQARRVTLLPFKV